MQDHTVNAESFHVNNSLPGEVWRIVPGFSGKYCVSSFGRLGNIRRSGVRLVKPNYNKNGYIFCRLCDLADRQIFKVHVLVMAVFVGPKPAGKQVNHKDGDKHNNRLDNLEYVTPSENSQHAIRTGLIKTGERSQAAKLTWLKVAEIRRRRAAGEKVRDLHKEYGVTRQTINLMLRGLTWQNPERILERSCPETIGSGREPTPVGGVKNAGEGANGTGTDGLSIINIEVCESSGESHIDNSRQDLHAEPHEKGEGPERILEDFFGNSPAPAGPRKGGGA